MFALHGIKVDSLQLSVEEICTLAQKHLQRITQSDAKGAQIVVVAGRVGGSADMDPVVEQHRVRVGGLYRRLKSFGVALTTAAGTPLAAVGTRSMRSTLTNLSLIQKPAPDARTTNIICTAGPACSSVEAITGLINAGCDILRFDFSSNTTHEGESINWTACETAFCFVATTGKVSATARCGISGIQDHVLRQTRHQSCKYNGHFFWNILNSNGIFCFKMQAAL